MNTLIDALLDLAHAARQPLRRERVDLADLFSRARGDLEADLAGRQMVMNLLENAVKYTRTREGARIEVRAEERPGEWVVLVRDNGVGFDPCYGEKLFGVFQRLHKDAEFEGTGVGLANVRRIVARHGGRVFAEGRPGEGASFGFTLPRG